MVVNLVIHKINHVNFFDRCSQRYAYLKTLDKFYVCFYLFYLLYAGTFTRYRLFYIFIRNIQFFSIYIL